MVSAPQVRIVTPVFLDTEAFLILRDRIRELLAGTTDAPGTAVTFTVLDDSAGADQAIDRLRDLSDVTVVEPPFQLGHQRGIVYALRTIASSLDDDIVVTMDADGQDRPEDLPRLLEALNQAGDTPVVVLALRTSRRISLAFKLLYLSFGIMFRLLTGTRIRTGNYVACRTAYTKRLLLHPLFDLSYSSTFAALGVPTRYVPCQRGERYAGRSRMGYPRLIAHGLRMLMPFVDRIAVRTLILFGIIFAIGLTSATIVVAVKLFSDAAIPGWATSTLIGTLLLSLISLGNFITLFTVFSESRATSLSGVEEFSNDDSRISPRTPD